MNSKVRMKSIFLGDWIQVCVLLQVLTEAAIKRWFGILEYNK